MSERLTKMGYDQIIERILNKAVDPPNGKTYTELTAWMNGYANCVNNVIDIILKMKEQER